MANDRLPPLPAGFDPVDELPPLPDGYEDAPKPTPYTDSQFQNMLTAGGLGNAISPHPNESISASPAALAKGKKRLESLTRQERAAWSQPDLMGTAAALGITPKPTTLREDLDDAALSIRQGTRGLVGGIASLPEMAINNINQTGNIITGTNVPMWTPQVTRDLRAGLDLANEEDANRWASDLMLSQRTAFDRKSGAIDSLGYLLSTPGALADQALQQVPQFAIPAGIGRAGGLGIGGNIAVQAGSAAGQQGATVAQIGESQVLEQARNMLAAGDSPDAVNAFIVRELQPIAAKAAQSAGASAVLNSILPIVGGDAAQTIERAVANQATKAAAARSIPAAIARGTLGEAGQGIASEGGDQAIQNVATGRPLGEGVGKAMAIGALMDGAPGGVAGLSDTLSARNRIPAEPFQRSEFSYDSTRSDVIPDEMLADDLPPLPEGYEPVETALTPEVFANRAAPPVTAAPVAESAPAPAPEPVADTQPARLEVTADTGRGNFRLVDDQAAPGADVSEFGQLREVTAYDGDNVVGTLLYANDGTPPTVNVEPEYQNRGIAKAMYDLAGQQGGKLGTAEGGMNGRGPQYRTPAGESFRQGMDARPPTVFAPVASETQPPVQSTPAPPSPASPQAVASPPVEAVVPTAPSTPAFNRFFSGSKITGDWEGGSSGDGTPRVLYHGTKADFDTFRIGMDAADPLGSGSGPVIFMGADPSDLRAAHNIGDGSGPDVRVIPLYANIKNPAYVTVKSGRQPHLVKELGLSRGWPILWTKSDVSAMEGAGYDGAVLFSDSDAPPEVVAFSPNQVKSADRNSGSFDSSNPSYTDAVASSSNPTATKQSTQPPEPAPVMGSLDVKPVAPKQTESSTESSPPPTGTKNAVTDAEREAESRDPVVRDMSRTHRQTVDMAKEALRENPRMVDELVARSHDTAISDVEEAALLVTKVQERNKREEASKTLADPNATKSQKDAARRAWDDAEAKIAEIDAANVARGRDWGRMGNFRRRLMAADFTLPALESKLRRAKGAPLTAEETASLKDLADRLQKTEGDLAAARKQIEEYEQNTIVRQTIEQAIKEALGQVRREGRAPAGKPKLEAMRERAEKARRSLAATPDVPSNRGQSGAVMSPAVFIDLYHIGAYHVANGASKFADWAKAMAADVGAKFTALERYWPEIFAASKAESAITDRIYAGKSVRTTAEVLAGINPENLTREDVRDLVFARIKAGATDPDAIMKAVTSDVQTLVPAATEADVRQLFADYGKRASPSRDADRTTLQNLRTIVRLENDIAKSEAGVLKKMGEPKRKASEEVRQLRERLAELLRIAERSDPAAIAAIRQARVENLKRRIADLEDQIATGRRPEKRKATEKSVEEAALEARRDELLREIRSIDRPRPDPEQRYQQGRATSIANEVKRLEERLKNNDYSRTPRVPKVLSEANQKALFELSKLRDEFRWKQFEAEMANRGIWGKAAVNLGQSFALLRAVMTSYDLSAIGRQGAFMLFSHPFRTLASVPDMLKAFASSEKRHAFEEGIGDRENAPLYKKYKLAITRNDGSLSSMEEVYMSRWLHSLRVNPKDGQPLRNIGRRLLNAPLGITRASERAYVTALNRIRADSFDAMVATLTKGGKEMTDAEGKLISDYVNSATGRASMPGKFEDAATMLNMVFFAPRLVTSRFQMLYGHHMLRGAGGGQKRVAAMIAADYVRAAAALYVIYQLATLWYIGSGAQEEDEEKDERRPFIEFDPRNSAFGQFRFGDHYVNPTGGLSQAATFMSRMITGETVTGAGEVNRLSDHGHSMTNFLADLKPALRKYGLTQLADSLPDANRSKRTPMEQDFGDVLARFARTKLAPAPGAMYDAWTGTDMMGQPIAQQGFLNDLAGTESRVLGALSGMMLPMTFGTPADAFREKGPLGGSLLTAAEIGGWGVQFRDRASFDMPDYQMASFDKKRDYSEYLRVSANIKQDIDELRNLANEFPADTPADEVIEAVEAKAELLGLDGVKVKEYSPRTTARDEMGFKKTGLQRTETGKVKMDFEDSALVSLMKDADKSIKAEDDKIKRVIFEDLTDAELDSMYRDYYPDGTADGDKKKVIDAIAAERERGMEFFMRARKE